MKMIDKLIINLLYFEPRQQVNSKSIFSKSSKMYKLKYGFRVAFVWVNGFHLGKRPNGYIGFSYDLTGHLKSGQGETNIIETIDSSGPICNGKSNSRTGKSSTLGFKPAKSLSGNYQDKIG